MNALRVCPECRHEWKLPPSTTGKAIRCPSCKAVIPSALQSPAPAEASEAENLPPSAEAVTAAPASRSAAAPSRPPLAAEESDGEKRRLKARLKKPNRKKSSTGWIVGLIVGGASLLVLALCGGGGLLVYFAWNKGIPEADWQTFSPPGSGCAIRMPGAPVAKPHAINGIAIDKYVVERKRERIVFAVAFLTLGVNPLKPNALGIAFDSGRDELLRRLNGTVTSERVIALGDIPGREVEVRASDGSRLITRLYLARVSGANRFYEISAGGFAAARDKGDVVRFFDSFQMDASATPPTILGGPVVQRPQAPIVNPPLVNRPPPNPAPSVRPREAALWSETSGTQPVAFAFSPDSATLAVGHWDKKFRLWDVTGRKDRQVFPLSDGGSVFGLAFSRDGKRLACGTDNGNLSEAIVLLWDVSNINAPKRLQRIPFQHTRDKARAKALCFAPDGKSLAVALVPDSHSGSQVLLWDLENNNEIAAYRDCKEDVKKLGFAPDGAVVILMPSSVRVWDAAANRIRREFKGQNPAERFVTSALSADGQTLAAMCQDKKLRLWRLSDGVCQQTWPVDVDLIRQEGCPFEFTPDGKYLAMRGQQSLFHFWDAKTGKALKVSGGDAVFRNVDVMAFSPDSRLLALHGYHGSKILEVASLLWGR